MSIKPLADRVLIEPAPAETKTVGGIGFYNSFHTSDIFTIPFYGVDGE